MSFSWNCYGVNQEDFFEKFDINHQALGLGDDEQVSRIRLLVNNDEWGYEHPPAARKLFIAVQDIIKIGLAEYELCHCDTCTCKSEPEGDVEQCKRFLSINPDDVLSFSGGW